MTVEERLERIEHITAGIAEERRKDRDEYKQLWRDTQRQISETNAAIKEVDERLGRRIEELGDKIDRLGDTVDRLGDKVQRFAEESRAADQRLGDRIEGLVSAMGKFFQDRQGPL